VTSKISPEAALLQEIPSDEMLLRQILMNLMSNASRHTPPGTTVELSLDVEQESSHVLLCVSDDGPGMTPDELAHAYDRFWRAEPGRGPTGGTGLGLAIVRSSVLALGGTIVMESLPGSGLAVTIRLPVVDRSIQ
jgi:two-component system OmpR family sensor kinase